MSKTIGELRCYCGHLHQICEEDLGFDEFECGCGLFLQVPETAADFDTHNIEIAKSINEIRYLGTLRVMAIQETGEECCLRNGVDEKDTELVELLLQGYQLKHPEWTIFTEQEELYC